MNPTATNPHNALRRLLTITISRWGTHCLVSMVPAGSRIIITVPKRNRPAINTPVDGRPTLKYP